MEPSSFATMSGVERELSSSRYLVIAAPYTTAMKTKRNQTRATNTEAITPKAWKLETSQGESSP